MFGLKTGKTTYSVSIKDTEATKKSINDFIYECKLQLCKSAEECYRYGNSFDGYCYFSYNINEDEVQLFGWTGKVNKCYQLEQEGLYTYRSGFTYGFREKLDLLIYEIRKANGEDVEAITTPEIQKLEQAQGENLYQKSENESAKVLVEVGFWGSIVAWVAVLVFGIITGIWVDAVLIGLSATGLKSNKKVKAIAGIVLSSLLIVFYIFLMVTGGLE